MADCKSADACRQCHGTGAVYSQSGVATYYQKCPRCNGKGERTKDGEIVAVHYGKYTYMEIPLP